MGNKPSTTRQNRTSGEDRPQNKSLARSSSKALEAPREAQSQAQLKGTELHLKIQLAKAVPSSQILCEGKALDTRKLAFTAYDELYNNFAPRDAADATLAALIIGISSAALECMAEAQSYKEYAEIRDMNLRNGFRGAEVTAQLVKAFDQRRDEKPKSVNVGNVNVEAGGQAIVGNVESADRDRRTSDEPAPKKQPRVRGKSAR